MNLGLPGQWASFGTKLPNQSKTEQWKKKQKGIFGNYWMNYLTEFDQSIDSVSMMHLFWGKVFFWGWFENIIKNEKAQEGITI